LGDGLGKILVTGNKSEVYMNSAMRVTSFSKNVLVDVLGAEQTFPPRSGVGMEQFIGGRGREQKRSIVTCRRKRDGSF